MARFSMYLPPLAPDYSGVCSALFDLNGLTVIHDAAGCTGNYTGFDEPRWYGSRKAVYCSNLREIDAILGNEDKFVRNIARAAREQGPEFIAFVGSPVPMVIGTDFEGIAKELEMETGLVSFGFATTGLGYYTEGVEMAGRALIARFAAPAPAKRPRTVNILGATPLDISGKNLAALGGFLAGHGWEVNACLFMGLGMEHLQGVGAAAVNLAVSGAGVRLGAYLRELFGTPCVTGLPCGAAGSSDLAGLLEAAQGTGEDRVLGRGEAAKGASTRDAGMREAAKAASTRDADVWDAAKAESTRDAGMREAAKGASARDAGMREGQSGNPWAGVLVVGEEVWANALGYALWRDRGIPADVGVLFGKSVYGDSMELGCERDIIRAVNDPRYHTVIADPLICDLVGGEKTLIPMSQYAVSSKTRMEYDREWVGEALWEWVGSAECGALGASA
ncbi:MAG: nitrogenase component 1 [Lachnospiraceae bacterium]|jgi:hypothetical protein|nr:nitrogenase component 1 [Lachnospiraceae bacterium]